MLENVAKKFNADIIDLDGSKPLPTGKALDKINKADYTKEIKDNAEALLQEGDEQFFLAKDLEILSVIGVDLKKCGLIMAADQGTTAEKDKDVEAGSEKKEKAGKDKPAKEVQPDQTKSTKKTKGKPKTVAENAEGNEGGGEDTKDTDLKKKDKPKGKKSEKKEKGPGVIASILQVIKDNGPVARESILDELTELFPDRDPKAMNKTVQAQIGGKKSPTRMEREKGVKFKIKDSKYSI
jgi:hypothetical protein